MEYGISLTVYVRMEETFSTLIKSQKPQSHIIYTTQCKSLWGYKFLGGGPGSSSCVFKVSFACDIP